jgi:hypothetical protein
MDPAETLNVVKILKMSVPFVAAGMMLFLYVTIVGCMVCIHRFEAAWDRGDVAFVPSWCKGFNGDPMAIAGAALLGMVIVAIMVL